MIILICQQLTKHGESWLGRIVFDCNILVSSHHMRDGCLTHNLQYSEEAVPSQDSNIVCMTLVMVSWHHILTLLTASFILPVWSTSWLHLYILTYLQQNDISFLITRILKTLETGWTCDVQMVGDYNITTLLQTIVKCKMMVKTHQLVSNTRWLCWTVFIQF